MRQMGLGAFGQYPVSMVRTSSHHDQMGYYNYTEMEKRQLFLRSYQFSRKKTVAERIKGSFLRVKRVIWVRLRSARKIRKIVWLKLRYGLFTSRRRRFFLRLHNYYNSSGSNGSNFNAFPCTPTSNCFW